MVEKKKSASVEVVELASKIAAHLKRMATMAGTTFHSPGAAANGRFVSVRYVSYHQSSNLCRAAAKIYLKRLSRTKLSHLSHYEVLVGTRWEHDSTGLRKAARSRSDERIKKNRLEAEEADKRREARRNAVGMELAADIVDVMAREQDNPGARRLLREAAAKIRNVAERKTGT
jgi:hypothetical protein